MLISLRAPLPPRRYAAAATPAMAAMLDATMPRCLLPCRRTAATPHTLLYAMIAADATHESRRLLPQASFATPD